MTEVSRRTFLKMAGGIGGLALAERLKLPMPPSGNLLFLKQEEGSHDVWFFQKDLTSGRVSRIGDRSVNAFPSVPDGGDFVSPDRKRLLIPETVQDGLVDLYVLNLQDGKTEGVLQAPNLNFRNFAKVLWMPDGESVVYPVELEGKIIMKSVKDDAEYVLLEPHMRASLAVPRPGQESGNIEILYWVMLDPNQKVGKTVFVLAVGKVVDGKLQEEVKLLGSEQAVDPKWSPNGRRLVYVDVPKGGTVYEDGVVWVPDPFGKGKSSLGKGYFPEWSPDGKYLSFFRSGGVVVYDVANRSEVFLENSGKKLTWLNNDNLAVSDERRWGGRSGKLRIYHASGIEWKEMGVDKGANDNADAAVVGWHPYVRMYLPIIQGG